MPGPYWVRGMPFGVGRSRLRAPALWGTVGVVCPPVGAQRDGWLAAAWTLQLPFHPGLLCLWQKDTGRSSVHGGGHSHASGGLRRSAQTLGRNVSHTVWLLPWGFLLPFILKFWCETVTYFEGSKGCRNRWIWPGSWCQVWWGLGRNGDGLFQLKAFKVGFCKMTGAKSAFFSSQ